jgi:hypothetical protein
MTGTKFDDGKPDWSLVDRRSMNEFLRVLSDGAHSHGRNNWQRVKDAKRRYASAAIRHAMAILDGEDWDPEHKTAHGAHLMANGFFLTWFAFRDMDRKNHSLLKSLGKCIKENGIAIKEAPREVSDLKGLAAMEALPVSTDIPLQEGPGLAAAPASASPDDDPAMKEVVNMVGRMGKAEQKRLAGALDLALRKYDAGWK